MLLSPLPSVGVTRMEASDLLLTVERRSAAARFSSVLIRHPHEASESGVPYKTNSSQWPSKAGLGRTWGRDMDFCRLSYKFNDCSTPPTLNSRRLPCNHFKGCRQPRHAWHRGNMHESRSEKRRHSPSLSREPQPWVAGRRLLLYKQMGGDSLPVGQPRAHLKKTYAVRSTWMGT